MLDTIFEFWYNSVSYKTLYEGNMDINNIHEMLKEYPIFKTAEQENLIRYITRNDVALCDFHSGEEICSPLSRDVPVGILISGQARIYSADNEKKVLIKSISDGAIFGISTIYSVNSLFPTRISAKSTCRVLFVSSVAVKALIENDKNVMHSFLCLLSNKIVYLNKKISSLTAGSAERRLSVFLCENAKDGVFTLTTSASALAAMLDIGRASLYRVLDKLEADGFIERKNKTIILKNEKEMLNRYSR